MIRWGRGRARAKSMAIEAQIVMRKEREKIIELWDRGEKWRIC